MYKTYIAVIIGGSLGCLLRWFFSMRLNNLFPNITFGTLLVNLLAGFIIGVSLAFFTRQPQLDPAWKLLVTTGFCGGLSTFSTFSAEIVSLLQNGNYIWAVISVMTHVMGSLLMTAAGFFIVTLF
ncbi:fluoride efflux transporter CrcB [Escherichia coli]|nr:fluoride efflux transporter CrcB [Escherichia coli]HCI5391119.1 fluoride efflux transporter CrcB [Klebsiella pneumoniae]